MGKGVIKMKVELDINVEHLRLIGDIILNRKSKVIREMSDEQLVIECTKQRVCCCDSIKIIEEER